MLQYGLDKVTPTAVAGWQSSSAGVGMRHASVTLRKEMPVMTKTFDAITEVIRNSKHPFRKADDQPKKAQKNRYERRKIKEYLHLGQLVTEEAT
jgi:hypothetical protein